MHTVGRCIYKRQQNYNTIAIILIARLWNAFIYLPSKRQSILCMARQEVWCWFIYTQKSIDTTIYKLSMQLKPFILIHFIFIAGLLGLSVSHKQMLWLRDTIPEKRIHFVLCSFSAENVRQSHRDNLLFEIG